MKAQRLRQSSSSFGRVGVQQGQGAGRDDVGTHERDLTQEVVEGGPHLLSRQKLEMEGHAGGVLASLEPLLDWDAVRDALLDLRESNIEGEEAFGMRSLAKEVGGPRTAGGPKGPAQGSERSPSQSG